MDTAKSSGSAWSAVAHKATTLLEVLHTRLDLLGNELEVARITVVRKLLLAQALLFCVVFGVMVTVMGLVLLFWEQRLVVVGLACALIWIAALSLFFMLRGNKHSAPLFHASLAELQEDLRQLKAAVAHHGHETR